MPSSVLELRDVTVKLHRTTVFERVSLQVNAGEAVGVRGRNGAGKTTLLRVLAGAFEPTAGQRLGPARCAWVPAAVTPLNLTAKRWIGELPRSSGTAAAFAALDVLGFDGSASRSMARLSFGNLRKVLLAEALTSGYPVVIDEASAGLDAAGVAGLAQLVASTVDDGGSVVVADQAARPLPPVHRVLLAADGEVRAAVRPGDTDTAIEFRGPASQMSDLLQAATELGFSPTTDGQPAK